MADLPDELQAIAQAIYDVKPSMIGAQKVAQAIDALVRQRIAEAVEVKRGPGRPKKES